MNELRDLERAVSQREAALTKLDREVDEAMMRAYRAQREDGAPQFTLTEIGRVLGVSRQRVYQLVRKAVGQGPGTRTGTGGA